MKSNGLTARDLIQLSPLLSERAKHTSNLSKKKGFETTREKHQYFNLNYVPKLKITFKNIDEKEKLVIYDDRDQIGSKRSIDILTEEAGYSSAQDISKFIELNSYEALTEYSAKLIKSAWKKHKMNKKFRIFFRIIHQIHRSILTVAFSNWRLATCPNPPKSEYVYKKMKEEVIRRGYVYMLPNGKQINCFNFFFCSYEFYMKTNIIWVSLQHDPKMILHFSKIMNKNMIRKIFQAWEYASIETKIHFIKDKRVEISSRYCSNYGMLFVYYIFWRRWIKLKKNIYEGIPKNAHNIMKISVQSSFAYQMVLQNPTYRTMNKNLFKFRLLQALEPSLKKRIECTSHENIEKIEEETGNYYLFFWRIYIANKRTKINLRKNAEKMYLNNIGKLSLIALKENRHSTLFIQNAGEKVQKIFDKARMLRAYKGLVINIFKKHSVHLVQKRVLLGWYSIIDKGLIRESNMKVLTQRSELIILNKIFNGWRENIRNQLVEFCYQTSKIKEQPHKIIPCIFLWKNDYVHYTFYAAFNKWISLVNRRKRCLKFVTFSKDISNEMGVKRYIFHLFKENSHIKFSRDIFKPFNDSFQKNKFSLSQSLLKIRRKSQQLNFSIESLSIPSNYADIVYVIQNLSQRSYIPKHAQKDWSKTLSSNQIKTLVFHLLIAFTFARKYVIYERTPSIASKQMKFFIKENYLFSMKQISVFRSRLLKHNEERRQKLKKFLIRDKTILNADSVHAAALDMEKFLPTFKVNDAPADISTLITLSNTKEPTNLPDEIHIKRSGIKNSNHPMLQSMSKIKHDMIQESRNYRRDTLQIEIDASESKIAKAAKQVRRLTKIQKTCESNSKLKVYEKYIPISKNSKQSKMVAECNINFSIAEIQSFRNDANASSLLPRRFSIDEDGSIIEAKTHFAETDSIQTQSSIKHRHTRATTIVPGKSNISHSTTPSNVPSSITITNTFKKTSAPRHKRVGNQPPPDFALGSSKSSERQNSARTDKSEEQSSLSTSSSSSMSEDEIPIKIEEDPNVIKDFSSRFITDPNFALLPSERTKGNFLTEKYLYMLDLLLEDSKTRPNTPNLRVENKTPIDDNLVDSMRSQITKYIRNLERGASKESKKYVENKKEKKQKNLSDIKVEERKNIKNHNLNDEPNPSCPSRTNLKKSRCPEFSNVLFEGDVTLTDNFWKDSNNKTETVQNTQKSNEIIENKSEDYKPLPSPQIITGFENFSNYGSLTDQFNVKDSDKTVSDNVFLVLDEIVKDSIDNELLKERPQDLTKVVNTDGVDISEQSQEEENSSKLSRFRISKGLQFNHREHKPFPVKPLEKSKEPIVHEQKITFTKSLFQVISESQKIIHPYIFRYYDSNDKFPEHVFPEDLRKKIAIKLKRIIEEKQEQLYSQRMEKYNSKISRETQEFADEISLTVKGSVQRAQTPRERELAIPKKAITARRNPQTSLNHKFTNVDKKNSLNDSIPKDFKNDLNIGMKKTVVFDQVPIGKKEMTKVHPGIRPKSAIKTTPTKPFDPNFNVQTIPVNEQKNNKKLSKTMPYRFQWDLIKNCSLTDEDIDYFLFISPYVVPINLINQLVDD